MTNRRELEALIAKARNAGAVCNVKIDADGWIETVQVSGLKGVGSLPMAPISFAERMREVL